MSHADQDEDWPHDKRIVIAALKYVSPEYAAMLMQRISTLEAEVKRLRRGFEHIAQTCIEDPDTAQFAARYLDGSAEVVEPVGGGS